MSDDNRTWGGLPASGPSASGPEGTPRGPGWTHQPSGPPPNHPGYPNQPGPQGPAYPNQGQSAYPHAGYPGQQAPTGYPGQSGPAYPNQGGQPPRKSRAPMIIGLAVGGVVLLAVIGILIAVLQPGPTTVASAPATTPAPLSESTPSAATTRPGAPAIRVDSQFGDNRDTHGWTCDDGCRVDNGKLRLSTVVPDGETDVDWWLTPQRGWTEEPVTSSTVVLTGVTFDEGQPFIGIKCAARIDGDEMIDGYQVELRSDGYLGHFELVNGEWSKAVNEDYFRGDTKNPGTIEVTCEKRGADFSVTMKVGDTLSSETTYRGVNRSGTTLLGYGGYGGAGTRSEVSVSGITYSATP